MFLEGSVKNSTVGDPCEAVCLLHQLVCTYMHAVQNGVRDLYKNGLKYAEHWYLLCKLPVDGSQ